MQYFIFALFAVSCSWVVSASAQPTTAVQTTTAATATVVNGQIIVTPVPAPKEVIIVPTGYEYCFKVASGWYGKKWIPEHQVCLYKNATQGTIWIDSYWSCNLYDADGNCTDWAWVPGHWVSTFSVY